jgi:hypothetical protein
MMWSAPAGSSGLVVHELLMYHSHTGPYRAWVTYCLAFINPGNWIHLGSRVSVMLGNARVEHVPVREPVLQRVS